jgi:hypothetical protein
MAIISESEFNPPTVRMVESRKAIGIGEGECPAKGIPAEF